MEYPVSESCWPISLSNGVWFVLYTVIMPYWYHLPRLGSLADLLLLGLPLLLAASFPGLGTGARSVQHLCRRFNLDVCYVKVHA